VSQLYHEIFEKKTLSKKSKKKISAIINAYAERSLRIINFLYKNFSYWPPADTKNLNENKNITNFDNIFHDII